MANTKDDYLTVYREFFEDFAKTVNPKDQLPVKLGSYKLVNVEVVGGIIDWTTQYLTQKNCPPHLLGILVKIVIDEVRKSCKKQPVVCGYNPSNNAYEPLKLMQTVMAKVNEVCLRYLDNSMLSSLPAPGAPYNLTSVCAMKNTRRKMEDRHIIVNDLVQMFSNTQEASPSSYYAIFDGHAGQDAADYSSAHLHQYLVENKLFFSDPEQALKDAFCKTDALFTEKCKVENLSSGTTAVCALLKPKEKMLYIAWVGDSQAILVKGGHVLQCVQPHKPDREDEKQRIEENGGCVILWGTWRVNGQLAVSRAIGDPAYKPYVTATPDVNEYALDGEEDFLVLACDGLWDFVSENSAALSVYNLLFENSEDTDRISKHLVHLAKHQGSQDNITVIVVFLKDPAKIVADAHRANHNGSKVTMDASLDNANNPFSNSNGTTTDNVVKTDDLLLHLTGNFKQNGTDLSHGDFFNQRNEFDESYYGPETDVDAVDDALMAPSYFENKIAEGLEKMNNNMEHQQKSALEIAQDLQKQQSSEFDEITSPREETPTPPADAVHDASGLDAVESDSEDEWNYIKGDEANKGKNLKLNLQPDNSVAESTEEDNMSQLNPNAAEFVPVSPTRSIPSPACVNLINDEIISQSPRRPQKELDVNVPNENDFDSEIKSRPSNVGSCENGHDEKDNTLNASDELMDALLNGKNIDEIPEFQPGSTPCKQASSEEFHFGPNATPFTPAKLLDQSEAALSTRAVYGDESVATLGTSFNESNISQDGNNFLSNTENDPLAMSFYEGSEGENPFDLNRVQVLPDNLSEFLQNDSKQEESTINNDDSIQTTDLDKIAEDGDKNQEDEKELASPVSQDDNFSDDIIELPKTPEPSEEQLNTPLHNNDLEIVKPLDSVLDTPSDLANIEVSNKEPLLNITENTMENNLLTCESLKSNSVINDVPASPICDIQESKSPVFELEDQYQALLELQKEESHDILETKSPILEQDLPISPEPALSIEHQISSPEPQDATSGLPVLAPESQSATPELQILTPEPQAATPEPQAATPESQAEILEPHEEILQPQALTPEPEVLPAETQALTPEPQTLLSEQINAVSEPIAVSANSHALSFDPHAVSLEPNVLSPVPSSMDMEIKPLSPEPEILSPEPQPLSPEVQILSPELQDSDLSSPIEEKQDICKLDTEKPIESPHEDITSSVKDDVSSPTSQPPQIDDQLLDVNEEVIHQDKLEPEQSAFSPVGEAESFAVRPIDLHTTGGEPIVVKTENIAPEFAEPAVVSPSEASEIASVPLLGTPEAAPIIAETVVENKVQEVKEEKSVEKKTLASKTKLTSPPAKKLQAKTSTTLASQKSSTLKPPATKSVAASRLTAKTPTASKPATKSPTVTAAKTSTTRSTTSTLASRSKPPAKPADKKPLTNGDIKTSPTKPTTLLKKTIGDSAAKPTRPVSSSSKLSPTKPPTSRPITAPRPAPRTTTTAKTASGIGSKTSITNTSLKSTTSTKVAATKPTATSPKTAATPKPRPPVSSTLTKPRVPLTRTVARSTPDADKQNKESANKLTASHASTSSTRTNASNATKTTTRRIELTKNIGSRTTVTRTTTTTTATKSSPPKKPAEITRNISKTKTTKVEKPKENGISAVVTEEITIVNNVINSALVKDNSPIDNKLIVENPIIEANTAD